MENFNIKKFLVENKLTTNSRILTEGDTALSELHSISNVSNYEGKEALNNALVDLIQIVDQVKPGASLNKMIERQIRDILVEFGEQMMDLGESLTRGELNTLSKVAAEE
jgi:hypothetical protein